jgi:putative PIN family toxin of toxin-antitoxin system
MHLDPMSKFVLDTNIVLDVWVFADAAAVPLREQLLSGQITWLATAAMRSELERVLAYPKIVPRLNFYKTTLQDVLAQFDQHAHIVEAASKAPVTCSDADDQIFIDLAVAHQAVLLSKDQAVLSMQKRLSALGVQAKSAITLAV